jgi:hypothetical protein
MKHLKKTIIAFIVLFVGAVFFAQGQSLAVTAGKPAVDGVVAADEYSYVKDYGRMKLYLSRTADTLYVAVVGNTTGWVSVGLGSLVMNDADIFIGYIADGKTQFKPQIGVGHGHRDPSDTTLANTIVAYVMKQDAGKTVLEMQLKAAPYIVKDQSVLDLILAQSSSASFFAMHNFMSRDSIPLK